MLTLNPAGASDDINIDFELGAGSNVVITVTDIAGKQVATVANDYYGQGAQTVSFNAATLGSGVYMYSIEAGNFKATKKFIVK